MEEMAISKFKATCLAVLERVRKTKKPILVTRFGEPIAEVHDLMKKTRHKTKKKKPQKTSNKSDALPPALESHDSARSPPRNQSNSTNTKTPPTPTFSSPRQLIQSIGRAHNKTQVTK